jgi:hypothetical protein
MVAVLLFDIPLCILVRFRALSLFRFGLLKRSGSTPCISSMLFFFVFFIHELAWCFGHRHRNGWNGWNFGGLVKNLRSNMLGWMMG